jgi:hypothetical protein
MKEAGERRGMKGPRSRAFVTNGLEKDGNKVAPKYPVPRRLEHPRGHSDPVLCVYLDDMPMAHTSLHSPHFTPLGERKHEPETRDTTKIAVGDSRQSAIARSKKGGLRMGAECTINLPKRMDLLSRWPRRRLLNNNNTRNLQMTEK